MEVPELEGLEGCSLLIALVLALWFNKELRSKRRRGPYRTLDGAKLRYLNSECKPRRKSAESHLRHVVHYFCRCHGLKLEPFRLANLEQLRTTFDNLNLNVRVYSTAKAYAMVSRFTVKRLHDK